ncbi:PleD family two-component system response regulator [Tepidamorphus sp. 3E244]|uniref:response regulator n=1 Tax=Tepidamorphus sp. 3E244 TaxID=3385498 RepID=UPI0038FC441F
MPHHDAFGLHVSDLDVAVVENSRAMQATLRSMMSAMGVRRVRTYDTGTEALTAMLADPPSVVLTAWQMQPMDGGRFVRTMRDPEFPTLCYVPIIVATAHTTLSVIDAAFSAGCNALLAKPLSPKVLESRLDWLVRDPTRMENDNGRIIVRGMSQTLENRVRNSALARSIQRTDALAAVMREEETASTPAPETKPAAPPQPSAKEANERAAAKAAAKKPANAQPAPKKRSRRWHGWDMGTPKGSTAA